jgi:hypothetical protein
MKTFVMIKLVDGGCCVEALNYKEQGKCQATLEDDVLELL